MRKSKAIAIIRKRKRNDGLVCNQNKGEHPIMLAVKAVSAFTQGTIILMKAIAEADDPNAAFEEIEKAGLFKLQMETGAKINAAIKHYTDRACPTATGPSPIPAENK
jgi:hypothetical protein